MTLGYGFKRFLGFWEMASRNRLKRASFSGRLFGISGANTPFECLYHRVQNAEIPMNIPADEMVYPPESVNWEYDPLCADCIKTRNWKRFSDIESAFEDYGMAVEGIACRAVWTED